jgi:hypothetical protein
MTPHWRNSLRSVKLVRWHQRPPGLDNGADLEPLLRNCPALRALDLSEFYCSTEDILPALAALTELDLGLAGDRTLAGGTGTPASAGPRVARSAARSRWHASAARCRDRASVRKPRMCSRSGSGRSRRGDAPAAPAASVATPFSSSSAMRRGAEKCRRRARQFFISNLFLFPCGVTKPGEKRLLAVGCQRVASVAATAPLLFSLMAEDANPLLNHEKKAHVL